MRGGIKIVICVYIKKVNTKGRVDLATPLPPLTIRTMRTTIAKSKNHGVIECWFEHASQICLKRTLVLCKLCFDFGFEYHLLYAHVFAGDKRTTHPTYVPMLLTFLPAPKLRLTQRD